MTYLVEGIDAPTTGYNLFDLHAHLSLGAFIVPQTGDRTLKCIAGRKMCEKDVHMHEAMPRCWMLLTMRGTRETYGAKRWVDRGI